MNLLQKSPHQILVSQRLVIITILNNIGSQIAPDWANGDPSFRGYQSFFKGFLSFKTNFLFITKGTKLILCLPCFRLGVGHVAEELVPFSGGWSQSSRRE